MSGCKAGAWTGPSGQQGGSRSSTPGGAPAGGITLDTATVQRSQAACPRSCVAVSSTMALKRMGMKKIFSMVLQKLCWLL